jgi:putative GTP pyrophosphokinase
VDSGHIIVHNLQKDRYTKSDTGVFDMDLPQVQDELVQFNEMILHYNSAIKEVKLRLEILRDEYKFVHQYDPIYDVKSRIKSIDSITAKLAKQNKAITVENIQKYVDDVAGIRICCNYSTDIYRLVDLLNNQKDIDVLNSKDYMNDPRPDGYRSYHMVIEMPVHLAKNETSVKVELQIRTTAMHSWALLADLLENTYDDYLPTELIDEIKDCAEALYTVDKRMIRIQDEISEYKKERQ